MKMYQVATYYQNGLETGEFKVGGTAEFDELEPINIIAYSGSNYPRTSEELQFFHYHKVDLL